MPPIEEHLLKYENVFVLGSGFSRAVGEQMPLLADLHRVVKDNIVTSRINDLNLESFFTENNPDYKPNFELLLTFLHSDAPWKNQAETYNHRGLFYEIAEILSEHIGIKEGQALRINSMPIWLQKLIIFFDIRQSPVITFNYDTIVERASFAKKDFSKQFDISYSESIPAASLYPQIMQDIMTYKPRARLSDGSGRRTMELIKLHGSINWLYSGTESSPGEQVYFYETREDVPDNDYAKIKTYVRGKKRLLIPPVSEKSPFYSNILIRTLWSDARSALAKARNIYFIGYSLPETDITVRNLLLTEIDPITKIYLVSNGSIEDEEKASLIKRYKQAMPQVPADNFIFDYITDDWPKRLTDTLLGSNPLMQWTRANPAVIQRLSGAQKDELQQLWESPYWQANTEITL